MAELTAEQRERIAHELDAIDSRLQDLSAMLRFICKAKGIDPDDLDRT